MCFTLIGGLLFAQNVNVTGATVGNGSYTTLGAALAAINGGVQTGTDNIIVEVVLNTTEAGPCVLNTNTWGTLTIRPGADGITVSGATATGRGLIELNGADNVTINGDNPNTGGTNRNLTFTNTAVNTTTFTSVIRVATATGNLSADNISINNCNLNGSATGRNLSTATSTTGSEATTFGVLVGPNGAIPPAAPGAITSTTTAMATSTTANSFVVNNCAIIACARGVNFLGSAQASSTSVSITNNLIGDQAVDNSTGTPPFASPANTVYARGVFVGGATSVTVSGNSVKNILAYYAAVQTAIDLGTNIGATVNVNNNTITTVGTNVSNGNAMRAINLASAAGPVTNINGNTITNIGSITSTGAGQVIGIDVIYSGTTSGSIANNIVSRVRQRSTGGRAAWGIRCNGGSGWNVVNNFVSDVVNIGNGSFGNLFNACGILLNSGNNHRVYHNTVNLFGTSGGIGSNSVNCLSINASTQTGIDVRNNVFSNTVTGATATDAHSCIFLPFAVSGTMNLTLNNNAYYSSNSSAQHGIAYAGAASFSAVNLYTAANFNPAATTPATNFRSFSSGLGVSANDNASFATTAGAPFVSATDLHITGTPAELNNTGASVGISTDIDNAYRSIPPDLGADEFTSNPCAAPTASVNYVQSCGTNQFSLEVTITALNGSTSVDVNSDYIGNPGADAGVGLGTHLIGPFPSNTNVVVSLVTNPNPVCNTVLGTFNFDCATNGRNALSFDGVNDRVSIANSASTNITGTQVSLEAWIYPTAFQAGTFQGSIINKELGANAGYMLRCGGNGVLSFAFGNGTSFPEVTSPTGTLVLNTWQHVAGTYDGTTMRIYKDGVQVGSVANATTIAAAPTIPLQIGHWSQNDTRGFFGRIDDARVWSVARTAGDILGSMNLELCGDEAGLAAYYRFNQGTAGGNNAAVTTATDQTVNANTGTLTGFALSGPSSNWVLGKTDLTLCVACTAAPTAGTISGSATACSAGVAPSFVLNGSTIGVGISRQWSYGPVGTPGANLLGTGLSQSSATIPVGVWEVQVAVTCAGFGTTTTAPFSFTKFATPTSVPSSNSPVCAGQPLNLTGGTDLGTTFSWTGPAAFTSTNQSPQVSASATQAMSGTYSLTTTVNGCTSAVATTSVVVNPAPTVSITPAIVALCPSSSATLTAISGFDLAAVRTSLVASASAILGTIPTPSGFTDGNTGTSISDGCNDMYDGGNFINTNLATAIPYTNGVVTNSASFGAGGSYFTQIIGSNVCGTSATAFLWAGEINGLTSVSITGDLGADGGGSQNSTSFTITANGVNYTAFVSRVFGAGDPSINHIFLVPQPNSASQTLGTTANENHVITGLSGVTRFYYMLFAGAGGVQYTDPQVTAIAQAFGNAIPAGSVSFLWAPNGETTDAISVSTAGTYTVTATAGGCSSQASRDVTVAATLTSATVTPPTPNYCVGGSVTLTATPDNGSPPYTYQWVRPDASLAGTTQTQVANQPGLWTVNITDNCGTSVTAAGSTTVVENPVPTAAASAGNACTNQQLELTGGTDIGTIFAWTGPNAFTSTLQNPTIPGITAAAGGTYTFTATSAAPASCTSAPSTVSVVVNSSPNVTAAASATPNPICGGGSTQLSVTATASGYGLGSGGTTFIDISGSGTNVPGALADDSEHNITMPSFTFNGIAYTTARVAMNGTFFFGSTTGEGALAQAPLPSAAHSAGNIFLAPWWDDLDIQTAPTIKTQTVGNKFIVQWTNLDHNDIGTGTNGITFQVQMDLVTGVIHFVYPDVLFGNATFDAAASATVGIQWANSAGNALQYSTSTASLTNGQVISFTPASAAFLWDNASFLNDATLANPVASNLTGNVDFTVTATANGCSVTSSVQVQVDPPPTAVLDSLIQDCENDQFSLDIDITGTGTGATAGISWTVDGVPGIGSPITGLITGANQLIGPFGDSTEVIVTILHENNAICNFELGTFYSGCPVLIDCAETLTENFCYENNEPRTFFYQSPTAGEGVQISFIQGSIGLNDAVNFYDGSSVLDPPLGGGNFGGNLAGQTFTSSGDSIFFVVVSNDTTSCEDGAFASNPWIFEVECDPDCTDPTVIVDQVLDCANQEFSLDVFVIDLGDSGPIDIRYQVGANPADTVFDADAFTNNLIGPFPLGSTVNIVLLHTSSAICNVTLSPITVGYAACPNDEPCDARPAPVNPDYTCASTVPGALSGATATPGITNNCGGTPNHDLWYEFVATSVVHRVQLLSVFPGSVNMTMAAFTGTCSAPTPLAFGCSTTNTMDLVGLTPGDSVFVRVYNTNGAAGSATFNFCVSAPPVADNGQNALDFDGTNDRVEVPHSASVDITGNNLTLEAWIYPTAWRPSSFQGSIMNKEAPDTKGYMLRTGASGTLSFNIGTGTAWHEIISSPGALALNTWQHIAGTFDGTTLRFYVNGVQITPATTTGTAAPIASTGAGQELAIGNWSQDNSRGFIGKIDEVRIWNTTLSGATLAANQNTQYCGGEVGLRAYYQFDQGINSGNNAGVTTLIDNSGNSNNGTLLNMALVGPTSNWVQGKTGMVACPPCSSAPVAGTITGTTPVCSSDVHSLSLTGPTTGTGITYQWYYGPVGTPTANTLGTLLTQSTASIPAGTWELLVDVTCAGFGTTQTAPFTFVKNLTPVGTPTSNAPVCVGSTLNLSVSATPGATYAWTGPNSFTSTEQNPSISGLTPSASGTYSLTATLGSCSASGTTTIVVNELPIVSITPDVVALCPPSGTAVLTAQTTATASLASVLTGLTTNSASILASIPTPSGFTDGNTGTNIGDGCNDMYDGGNFINTNLATAIAYTNGVVTPSASFGAGGSYFTRIIGSNICGSSATAFIWAGDINGLTSLSITGNLGADGGGSQNSTSFTLSANGITYTVLASRVFGAGDPSINHLFFIPQPNSATQTLGNTADENHVISGIAGVSRFYYMLFAGAAGVQYTDPQTQAVAQAFINAIPVNTANVLWSTSETTPSITVSTANTYTVTATVVSTGCQAQASREVTIADQFTSATITPATPAFCTGSSVTLTATPNNGAPPYSYQWVRPDASLAGTSQTQAANVAGVWTVNITDNCGNTVNGIASPTVVENPVPTASASAGLGCLGADLSLTGTTNIGTSFAWSGPNGFTSTEQNPVIASATAAAAGTYTFTATAVGCTSLPATVSVVMNTSPVILATTATPTAVCSGSDSQLQVSVQGPSVYCASTHASGSCGFSDAVLNVTLGTLSNTSACLAAPGYSDFTSLAAPVLNVAGGPYTLSVAMGTDGTQFAAAWIDFNHDGDFADGNEFLGASANVGSSGTASFVFSVPGIAGNGNTRMRVIGGNDAVILSTQSCGVSSSGFGETEDYTVTITGGSSLLTYAWSPSTFLSSTTISNPMANDATATTPYTVTVTNAAGCTTDGTVTLTVNDLPVVDAGTYSTVCGLSAADVALVGTPAGGTFSGTGVSGAVNSQVFDPSVGTQTLTYTYSNGTCSNTDQVTITVDVTDTDGDGTPDCGDSCPTVFGQVGDFCDSDPGAGIAPGVLDGTCSCVAIPCTENVVVDLRTDANSQQASFQILADGTNAVLCQGGINPAFPANVTTPIVVDCCLPAGCYRLVVSDAGGDGFVTGGYQLREQGVSGRRIIDNFGNFNTGSTSAISTAVDGGVFCLPIGNDRMIFNTCDKLDWVANQYLVAHANAAVSAEWIIGGANSVQDANSGYEFWIFDPNGSYSFRRFRSHNVSDGFSPASANRACHMKINSWANTVLTPHIPSNVLMNVRLRGRVNGVNVGEFGPACTMKIDAARAACPLVWLQDDPANTADYSCNVTRNFGGGGSSANRIVARPPQFQPPPLAGGTALRYQFRFRIPGENICIVRPPQTSATMTMNWTTGTQLECGKTYQVEVRVSKDGGATWCVDSPTPSCVEPVTQWGRVCSVTIATSTFCPNPLDGGNSSMAAQGNGGGLTMYPNPNRGDLVYLAVSEVAAEVKTISVDIFDLSGKRVSARTIAVQDGFVNTVLDLNGDLAGGMYMVNVTAGDKVYTERLVIQP